MTKQNIPQGTSYRIRNYEDQLATVWQIGNGDFFAVKFDEDDEPLIYTKEQVANAFTKVMWEIAPDEPVKEEESLPRTFKFVCRGYEQYIYTFTQGKGYSCEEWFSDPVTYSTEAAIKNIQNGDWIVLPSESKVNLVNSNAEPLTFEIYGKDSKAFRDAEQALIDYMKPDIIQRIKSATEVYDMTISVDGGTYHIYDNLCDMSYKADTDEKLIEILNAIDFLSEQVA